MRFAPFTAAFVLATLTIACGGDGVGPMDDVMQPGGGTNLAEIQDNIFTPRCALVGCHVGPNPEQGMDLSTGSAFASIVNVPSNESVLVRVSPGRPSDSYLFLKVTGDAGITGERMPLIGPPLSDFDIDAIRDWIESGALDN